MILRVPELATLSSDTVDVLQSRPPDAIRLSNFEGWLSGYTRRYGLPDDATRQFCEEMSRTITAETDMSKITALVTEANIAVDKNFVVEYLGAYKLYMYELKL